MKPEPLTSEEKQMIFAKWREIKGMFPTPAEYRVLNLIGQSPAGSISDVNIAAKMHRSTLRNIIHILENKGWLKRGSGRDSTGMKCTVFGLIN